MCQLFCVLVIETHSASEIVDSIPFSVVGSEFTSNVAPWKLIVQVPELGVPHEDVIVKVI